MRKTHLLSACFVSFLCGASAFAQSSTPPAPPATFHAPPLTQVPSRMGYVAQPVATLRFVAPSGTQPAIVSLAPEKVCYSMRSYNFAPGDVDGANPRPSSATTCTPTASLRTRPASVR